MSKGENMVERLAQTIESGVANDHPSEHIARLVLATLMEPTPEMIDAALYLLFGLSATDADDRAEVADTFTVMLRTILSQPNDEGEGK